MDSSDGRGLCQLAFQFRVEAEVELITGLRRAKATAAPARVVSVHDRETLRTLASWPVDAAGTGSWETLRPALRYPDTREAIAAGHGVGHPFAHAKPPPGSPWQP